MVVQAVITPQWQVYLPEKVRRKLGLKRPGYVEIKVRKDHIIIKPIKGDFLSLAGFLKGKKPKKKVDLDNIRDYIEYDKI